MSKTILLNQSDWHFTKENPGIPTAVMGEAIALPHTWNAVDGQDGGNDYYRGTCWYTLALAKPAIPAGGKAVLQLDGAAMTAAVYLNGEKLLDNQDLCFMLKVSTKTLQRYRKKGILPYIMLDGKYFYRASDIHRLICERTD